MKTTIMTLAILLSTAATAAPTITEPTVTHEDAVAHKSDISCLRGPFRTSQIKIGLPGGAPLKTKFMSEMTDAECDEVLNSFLKTAGFGYVYFDVTIHNRMVIRVSDGMSDKCEIASQKIKTIPAGAFLARASETTPLTRVDCPAGLDTSRTADDGVIYVLHGNGIPTRPAF